MSGPELDEPGHRTPATKLRKLRISRVDTVSRGANPGARILIAKSAPAATLEVPAYQLGRTDDGTGEHDHTGDEMPPAVAAAIDRLERRIADTDARIEELMNDEQTSKSLADAADAERELWSRAGAVAKSAGMPLDAAMVHVLDADPALRRRIEEAPKPAAAVRKAEPAPLGAAGRQLHARAATIAKSDGVTFSAAMVAAADADPDLAVQALNEQWAER